MGTVKSFAGLCLCVFLAACGYQLHGYDTPAVASVLGDGSKTLKITAVEQTSLYPWVPHFLRSLARDEINLRKLAQWVDDDDADYNMEIRVPSFQARSFVSDNKDVTLINSAIVELELVFYHGANGTVAWRSGIITYSERYEYSREGNVIQEALTQAMSRALDRMIQRAF